MKNREAKLIPKWIDLRIEENRISIKYKIEDVLSGVHVDDTWINFTPSDELMKSFEEEIEMVFKKYKK